MNFLTSLWSARNPKPLPLLIERKHTCSHKCTTVTIVYVCFMTLKVMYVTATAPYVFMLILLIRGCTLKGAGKGIIYYLNPTIDRLGDMQVCSKLGMVVLIFSLPADFTYFHLLDLRVFSVLGQTYFLIEAIWWVSQVIKLISFGKCPTQWVYGCKLRSVVLR